MSRRDERVRVLRVISRLNIGGPAVHATLLSARLDASRYESLLATGREDRSEGNYLALSGTTLDSLVLVPALRREIRLAGELDALKQLVALVRQFRPQIVHTHTAKAGTLGRLAARWCRVPVTVHTYHGHVLQGYFGAVETRIYIAIERWLARRTTRLLAVSERVREELLALGIGRAERFDVVPLGLELAPFLDAEAWRGQLRHELGYSEQDVLVGIVARLVPIKAHEIFLRAAVALSQRAPHTRFLVIGDGERRAELETLARQLGLGDRVRFLGWRLDLHRVYVDLDVVVLASRNEGSPVSLIEAMAAARPVVATRVGGVPDIVKHGRQGLLVPADDVEALASAIEDVVTAPDRGRKMGEAGRTRVYPAFTAERLVADIDRLYTELLAR